MPKEKISTSTARSFVPGALQIKLPRVIRDRRQFEDVRGHGVRKNRRIGDSIRGGNSLGVNTVDRWRTKQTTQDSGLLA